jgi:polar amino acid transport system permease protein
MNVVLQSRDVLFSGLIITLQLFCVSAVIATTVSVIAGLLRVSPILAVRWIATTYVELFRGTSVVVQMFWLYFALPNFGITLEAFQTAVIALGLCFGAYGSEVVRGALLSVPKGQFEAAIALNMTTSDCMRRIVFPQAFAAIIPQYTNILVLLLKSTAAASLITIPELTFRATSLNQVTFATTWLFGTVLVTYFVVASFIAFLMRWLERAVGHWRSPQTVRTVSS